MHTKGQYIMYQSTYRQARRRFYSIIKKICECWNGIVRIDVPHSQFTFRQFLQTENFKNAPFTSYDKNGSQLPGNRNMLFAMIDTALC